MSLVRLHEPAPAPGEGAGAGETCDVAVLDVGSNSVRLVLYRLEGRAIWTVFNEKVLAGLGRNLSVTRRLSPDGVETALTVLRRFRAVVDGAGVSQVFAAATAAVRDSLDGPAFIERIRAEAGFRIDVLSGEAEARASALGVLAGQPDAEGVVADLGGSSLELVRLRDGEVGQGVTLPLGPFALGAGGSGKGADLEAVARLARRRMDEAAGFEGPRLHAVGGAWRNLALLHMQMTGYPLNIVHQYEVTAADALQAARLVARQSPRSLDRVAGLSKKRADTLPYAAIVLEALVERLGVEQITFSAYGLREGLILQAMDHEVRRRDPLVEGCRAMGCREGLVDALGPALEGWLAPAWAALPPVFGAARDRTLMAAACRLGDIGARLHPDHRAELVFERVLRAPIAGQTHPERAYLAIALFARHASSLPDSLARQVARMLSGERLARARALGAALRLGCNLSGRSPDLLAATGLSLQGRILTLSTTALDADLLLGEQTRKRLATLAQALSVEGRTGVRG